jgi:hypothetical protein
MAGGCPKTFGWRIGFDTVVSSRDIVARSARSAPRTSHKWPPGLAARFILAEQAVLAPVAAEVVRRKACRLSIEKLAAVAGPLDREERDPRGGSAGPVTVEERQITGFRNGTNVLRIVSPEWLAQLRLARGEYRLAYPYSRGALRPALRGRAKA